jgi:hypothetical protein
MSFAGHPELSLDGAFTFDRDFQDCGFRTQRPAKAGRYGCNGHVRRRLRSLATALLDGPLPWTRMRRVCALLGLVRRYGDARVNDACTRSRSPPKCSTCIAPNVCFRPAAIGGAEVSRDQCRWAVSPPAT